MEMWVAVGKIAVHGLSHMENDSKLFKSVMTPIKLVKYTPDSHFETMTAILMPMCTVATYFP